MRSKIHFQEITWYTYSPPPPGNCRKTSLSKLLFVGEDASLVVVVERCSISLIHCCTLSSLFQALVPARKNKKRKFYKILHKNSPSQLSLPTSGSPFVIPTEACQSTLHDKTKRVKYFKSFGLTLKFPPYIEAALSTIPKADL